MRWWNVSPRPSLLALFLGSSCLGVLLHWPVSVVYRSPCPAMCVVVYLWADWSMWICSYSLTYMLYALFAHVGTGLGLFDPDRVPELHLPTFPGASGAGEPRSLGSLGVVDPGSVGTSGAGESGTAHGRKTAGEEVGKGPRKFMLGVNSPVVPARIVKRILNCEFGDMAELSNENLELEKRRSGEGDDAKASTRGKLRSLPDLLAWARAFSLYAGVVLSAYPSKGMELATYQAMILHGPDSCDWWRTYDPQFREQFTDLGKAEFTRIDQTLYSRSLWTASAMGSQRVVTPTPPEHTVPPRSKRKRSQVCYAWNDGKLCPVLPCRYAHLCARCGGDHRRSVCVPSADPAGD